VPSTEQDAAAYPALFSAEERPRSNFEVRRELRKLLDITEARRRYHVAAWKRSGEHPSPCRICLRVSAEQDGIRAALKLFGGRPNAYTAWGTDDA